jgi:hypothetical protein
MLKRTPKWKNALRFDKPSFQKTQVVEKAHTLE